MKYCFIINPAAGKASTKEGLEQRILSAAEKKGVDAAVFVTEKVGDTPEYIKKFAEDNVDGDINFYVCGGDGTLCEAVNAIMALPDRERICLGVVPVGTGNDFVRNFGNKQCFLDIEAQLEARPVPTDLLKCNDLYCINMINIGFDCQVVVRTAKIKRHRLIPSKLAYICGLILTLAKKPGVNVNVKIDDGEERNMELLLTTFANGGYCGGGFHSNPRSTLYDGCVDALFVKDISRTKFVSIVSKYKKGTHLDGSCDKLLSSQKAQNYKLRFECPTVLSMDGEIITAEQVDIGCLPKALNILLPKGAEVIV